MLFRAYAYDVGSLVWFQSLKGYTDTIGVCNWEPPGTNRYA
jgi:hypothetical protein